MERVDDHYSMSEANEVLSPLALHKEDTNDHSTTIETSAEVYKGALWSKDKIYLIYIEFMKFYLSQPLWLRVFGTVMAMIIVIDGAVLFFTLVGAFGYLSNDEQDAILEWSIQIINACFTLLCLIELPFRVKNIIKWLSVQGKERVGIEEKMELTTIYKKPIDKDKKWIIYGVINSCKIFQIFCQCCVQYLCLAYVGRQGERPGLWFGVAVGLALPMGCTIGGVEGYLKS